MDVQLAAIMIHQPRAFKILKYVSTCHCLHGMELKNVKYDLMKKTIGPIFLLRVSQESVAVIRLDSNLPCVNIVPSSALGVSLLYDA
jgi:hypothetical protein